MKPHRIKYWLNHEVEDEAAFRQNVRTVCQLYHQAQEPHESGVHVVSVDEKTDIQALERIHPDQPMSPGKLELHEFAYARHGTQTLIANFEVATGRVISPSLGDTRGSGFCRPYPRHRGDRPRRTVDLYCRPAQHP